MIILDTNVVSDLMRAPVAGRVASWIDGLENETLSITAVTVAEILQGIRVLPKGRRRAQLTDRFAAFLDQGFHDGILPFDAAAADACATIVAERRGRGRPATAFDAMIAAIAVARRAEIATRDVAGFADCGVTVINPWD